MSVMMREHVSASGSQAQHTGFGRRLMAEAERRATRAGFARVAVISGVGARDYYRLLGYELAPGDGGFMLKELPRWWHARARAAAFPEALVALAVLALALAVGALRAVM